MYTTDVQAGGGGTVSATDEERLPPGGFSLRHGFPAWFSRGGRGSRPPTGQQTPKTAGSTTDEAAESTSRSPGNSERPSTSGSDVTVYEVLRYMRSTFDDGDVLDSVPIESAGNSGAWNAWRAHRIKAGKIKPTPISNDNDAWHEGLSDDEKASKAKQRTQVLRQPGEWNWGGVWEVRVKKGIDNSLSEPMLFGNMVPGDDLVSHNSFDGYE